MRLGVDFHTFDGIYQGSRSHLLGLYRAAVRQAPDIDFYFFLDRPQVLESTYPEFAHGNVHLVRMPHRPGALRLLWQLPALQRRHGLDLLHLQYRLPPLYRGRCLCTIHDILFETHPQYFGNGFARVIRWSARHAVRHAALTLTVSEYSRRELARLYGLDPQRIALTPNAVDRDRFHPGTAGAELLTHYGLASGGYICTLGRLEPRKNHLSLVQAYARLPPEAPPLIIIGQRDFAYDRVFEAIRELHLQERVRVLENIDDAQLPVLLRHARLMAYPSLAEGFGMPVLEAMASGVPVITSNTTSLPEIAGDSAWLVPPTDLARLSAALADALAEAPAARALRIEAGLRHAARFDWRESAANLLAAVRALSHTG